jgi:4-diphosphocytidyl-2-C-methyl-D-erythritol kinase
MAVGASSEALADFAPAKVNLTLHVPGKRADGYHELESLVVFASVGDRLTLVPGELALDISGPTAAAAGEGGDNLVLKAARGLAERVAGLRVGRFALEKSLPVAAGLGGGSSDAAAALRLLAKLNGLGLSDPRLHAAATATGADVPVCLDPHSRMMRGIGEILGAPVALPKLHAVLVNPRVPVPTKDVFATLAAPPLAQTPKPDDFILPHMDAAAIVSAVAQRRNDLEAPALKLQPVIGDVLTALQDAGQCRLARMSGSGATCFGIYFTADDAQAAAHAISARQPGWWVQATMFGG